MKTRLNILLIEDDELDVMTFKRAMRDLGMRQPLTVASTGEEAVTWLAEQGHQLPDIIVMDLNMPRMNGIELIAILKTHSTWRRIPIIVLTTSNQPAERQQCFAFSIAGYIVKPMDYQIFVEMLQTIYAYWRMNALSS